MAEPVQMVCESNGKHMVCGAKRWASPVPPQAFKSLDDLHNAWYAKLTAPQARILERLIEVYPEPLTKAELAELAGASATSSAYQNNLGALRSLGVVDYSPPGHVVATALLFPEGLT